MLTLKDSFYNHALHAEAVQALLDKGAKLDIKDNTGKTARDHARELSYGVNNKKILDMLEAAQKKFEILEADKKKKRIEEIVRNCTTLQSPLKISTKNLVFKSNKTRMESLCPG